MFRDAGQTLEVFADTIYVRCPQCARCASVMRIPSPEDKLPMPRTASKIYPRVFSPRKLSCLHCGHNKTCNGRAFGVIGRPYDWYFHLPLWLQTPCCGEILWAFNEEHLAFLENYVSAKQRARPYVLGGARNRTLASKLPLWFKSAKNRETVLKSITQLKSLLAQR